MKFQMLCIVLHQHLLDLGRAFSNWRDDHGFRKGRFFPAPATSGTCYVGVSTRGPDWLRVERMYLAWNERAQPNVIYTLRILWRLKLSVCFIRNVSLGSKGL